MDSKSSHLCPECGKPVPAGSPHQLCPACLMGQALASRTLVDGDDDSDVPPPLSPEEIAEKFPQFEITECLGRGGMGSVYKARQKSLNRWVAIKILAPEREGRERFAERFAREAQTLARLSHPHIVTIHDFGQTDGLFYLVMEYVDGVNLRELLHDGKIEPAQALTIVPPICDALQYAHDKGVVHRDIKPENLLLDRDGRVKIADFGIASLIGAENESAGTPDYMAPEQADAKREVDHRADIYALGVVLYEMLTGERPGKEVIAPSRKVQIDVRLDEIVLRALEKEPGRRYQTVDEFRTVVDTVASARGQEKVAPYTSLIPQEELDALSADPANWRFAIFYFCRQDPRIVVPKRTHGFGWTVNLANPWAIPFMIAVGLGIFATFKLMKAAGLGTRPYQIGTIVAILTVIVWICHRLSRGPAPRKGSPSPLVRTLITAVIAFGLAISLWKMPGQRSFKNASGESDPSSEAVNRAPNPVVFGALTEREIPPTKDDAHGLTFFSLARGEVAKPPFPVKFVTPVLTERMPPAGIIEITPQLKEWAKAQKVDLVFAFEPQACRWHTLEIPFGDGLKEADAIRAALRGETRSEHSYSPADALKALRGQFPARMNPKIELPDKAYVSHIATSWYPKQDKDTWSGTFHIFETRTGQVGIIEIMTRPAGKGVKLRYKLAQEPGASPVVRNIEPARPPVAEERHTLKVQFGDSPDDPALTTDIQLGVAFSGMKTVGKRTLSIDGRIDPATDGLYRGQLQYLDVDSSNDLSAQKSSCELALKLGEPFRFVTVNGIARTCVVTLTRKQPDDEARAAQSWDPWAESIKNGEMRQMDGDLVAALKHFQSSLVSAEKTRNEHLRNQRIAESHVKIGDVLSAQNELAKALDHYRSSMTAREEQAKKSPQDTDVQKQLTWTWVKLGDVQKAQGDPKGALTSYRGGPGGEAFHQQAFKELPTDYKPTESFKPEELAQLAANPKGHGDFRRLMWLINRAGAEKDANFRHLLDKPELRKNQEVHLALTGYDYSVNGNKKALDDLLAKLATEVVGSDSSVVVALSFIDEWDRSIKAVNAHFTATDGAGGMAETAFWQTRAYLFPRRMLEFQGKAGKGAPLKEAAKPGD